MKLLFKALLGVLIFVLLLVVLILRIPIRAQEVPSDHWIQVIPSEGLPADLKIYNGNNNIDLVRHQGRFYIGFRTSPTHFASTKTRMYVISSSDFENWKLEKEIHLSSDKREPRFALVGDTLFLYFFEAGTHPLKFEPKRILYTFKTADGWSDIKDTGLDHYVPWRIRAWDGHLLMSAYYGKGLYSAKDTAGDLRLFRSDNGHQWEAISEEPQIGFRKAEEGAFIFDADSNLWANVRLEGDGSFLCFAHKTDLTRWDTTYSRYKYDSAIMLRKGEEIYMISRRNLDGPSSKGDFQLYNLIRYSLTMKKTALFRLDQEAREWIWLRDFPSTGDNAFPAVTWLNENHLLVLNYSSDINKRNKNWIRGQLGKTFIYAAVLDMRTMEEVPYSDWKGLF